MAERLLPRALLASRPPAPPRNSPCPHCSWRRADRWEYSRRRRSGRAGCVSCKLVESSWAVDTRAGSVGVASGPVDLHRKARAPHGDGLRGATARLGRGRAAEVGHRHRAVAEDRQRSLLLGMGDRHDAAAHADRRRRRRDRRAAAVRRLAADDAQQPLRQIERDLALGRRRIEDEFVDDDARIDADVERRLVDEQQLDAAGSRRSRSSRCARPARRFR